MKEKGKKRRWRRQRREEKGEGKKKTSDKNSCHRKYYCVRFLKLENQRNVNTWACKWAEDSVLPSTLGCLGAPSRLRWHLLMADSSASGQGGWPWWGTASSSAVWSEHSAALRPVESSSLPSHLLPVLASIFLNVLGLPWELVHSEEQQGSLGTDALLSRALSECQQPQSHYGFSTSLITMSFSSLPMFREISFPFSGETTLLFIREFARHWFLL